MEADTEDLSTDSDVLMNLLATGEVVAILKALRMRLLISPVVDGEAFYLEGEEPGDPREAIDLSPLEMAGVLVRVELSDEELNLVVDLARSVDDGEAEAIAVGSLRGLRVATDDRKARQIATRIGCVLLSTPDVLRAWQQAGSIADDVMTRVLSKVSSRSRYRPPRDHPFYQWWMELITGGSGR